MPTDHEAGVRYELVDVGAGWYHVVATPPPPAPPAPGEPAYTPEELAEITRRKTVGHIGGRWDGTFGVAYTACTGQPIPLGRVITPGEGRLLLEQYRRARLVIDLAETWGRNDALHLAINTGYGERP